ncbi:3-hydroxyacyl-ACP dehydratase FabZ family protein [Paenibacillus wulumuqiensis]|uniref:3-hydroxyacyl-ACP dehydratase FabZ family protein n=1 Tax=Paenibacillus wulumuqiensis TaxID=1567107 RepID=UPI0006990B5A|nr:3-hydroxyacyl-ACP dehydratase FabZ family protein [Paenibacillus wulumuqiensis]
MEGRVTPLDLTKIHIPDVLPHRYPFLMIDEVSGYETSGWARGYKLVSWNEWYISEAQPYMPSTLVVESLAQLLAFATIDEAGISFLTTLKGVRVLSQAAAGERIDLYVEVLRRRKGYVLGKGIASVGERIVLEADEIVSYDLKR